MSDDDRQLRRIENDVYVSIKEHFKELLTALDKRVEQALLASRAAVDKANSANEKRLDLLNEFRGQAADEGQRYALRETVDNLSSRLSYLYGGLVVVGVIGIANLVKLFL